MKQAWIDHCLDLSRHPADLYSGCRKIIRNVQLQFPWESDLTLPDAGYSSAKMKQLERNYLHPASIEAAVQLWERYRAKPKYRSVSFTTYNHFIKDHRGPRGSVMGPCLQSVVLTMLSRKEAEVTVLYRTTELLKKFPADLVFLKERLLSGFDFSGMQVKKVNCFFTNLTVHPMYFVVILPHLENPTLQLDRIRRSDQYFFDWIVKWTARYLVDNQARGIAKFAQAMRQKIYADRQISAEMREKLIPYLKKHHPGFTRTSYAEAGGWVEDSEDEE